MRKGLTALVVGALFGLGLFVSGMYLPQKVLGFLDVFGLFDPSLALVMGAAVCVGLIGFRIKPLHHAHAPSSSRIDVPLVLGSAVFGIGWGLAGLCPGPALFNLGWFESGPLLFVAAMAAGMVAAGWVRARLSGH